MTPSRTRRRGTRRGPTRCTHCGAIVAVFGSPFRRGAWMTFEKAPVNPRKVPHPDAFPVYLRHAYLPADLAAQLQGLTGCTVDEATDEVRAQPWHRRHMCLVLAKITGADMPDGSGGGSS